VTAFQQIMAQQVRRWKTLGQKAMKRPQFVNAFAVIAPFTEQILVNVGDRMGIRIDPTRIGKDT
jgi:hypothetical protein